VPDNQKPEPRIKSKLALSIVIPTYNESGNILNLIKAIRNNLSASLLAEIIVVDDDSPDGTGKLVESYIKSYPYAGKANDHCLVRITHRPSKQGLIPAILAGIDCSSGANILIMDADFSHPPEVIPRIIDELRIDPDCIVVASRYISGGSIAGWPYKRRMISTTAAQIARYGLNMHGIRDPMSGFFAFPRHIIQNVRFDTGGYKLLLELLVKVKGNIRVKEIPYAFADRHNGESKLDFSVMIKYVQAVWVLYRYGQKSKLAVLTRYEKRKSVLFLSKAGRFFTVGASGLLLNYIVSFLLSGGILSNIWYINASVIGIVVSIVSNFLLNKTWTFEDRDFSVRHTLKQFALFVGISSFGAFIQLTAVYILIQSYGFQFSVALMMAVAIASAGNFILNKKLTFEEKIWG